jgi:predicted nucleic acid-binding protein
VLIEPGSAEARQLWRAWVHAGERLITPPLFSAEMLTGIRKRVFRRILSEREAESFRQSFMALQVEIREPAGLYDRAWQIAERFNRPTVYDACYLALAEIEECELWTADERFARAVRQDRVRVLEYAH